jgi:ubiquitin carboxyl-terminal hydrolase L3
MAVPDAPKQFVPLESNPQVFNSMLHDLGGSPNLVFHDVYSISDPDLLAIVPRPVYALVLILPFALSTYKADKEKEEAVQKDYVGDESDDDVCFIRQTIHNACSLWSIFHAVCNEPAKHHISMSSPFSHPSLISFLRTIKPLTPYSPASSPSPPWTAPPSPPGRKK